MYAYIKFIPNHIKDFNFLECLLFGALISATDPGMFCLCNITRIFLLSVFELINFFAVNTGILHNLLWLQIRRMISCSSIKAAIVVIIVKGYDRRYKLFTYVFLGSKL